MALRLVLCAYLDVLCDGSSTMLDVNLAADAVSFAAGINSGVATFDPTRQLNQELNIAADPPTTVIAVTDQAGGNSVSGTLTGTILSLTWSAPNTNNFVARLFVEMA